MIDYRTIIGLKNISEVMYVFDKRERLLPQEVTTDTESPVSVCDIKHNDSNRRNRSYCQETDLVEYHNAI